jgi:hypothetical protein
MGFLVVTAAGERFVPVRPAPLQMAIVWLAGFAIGWVVARRSRSA